MNRTTIKRGATLQYDAEVGNAAGPVDLAGWSISSQVRTPQGALVGSVSVTLLDQTTSKGQYRLHADTTGWMTGLQVWDIKYAWADGLGGQTVTYTETVQLVIEAAVTEATP